MEINDNTENKVESTNLTANNRQPIGQVNAATRLNRRNFLKQVGITTVAAALAAKFGSESKVAHGQPISHHNPIDYGQSYISASTTSETQSDLNPQEQEQHHEGVISEVQIASAIPVVGAFGVVVAGAAAGKWEFNPWTVGTMSTIEAGRLAWLSTHGEGEHAMLEGKELAKSLGIAVGLGVMAELSSNTRASVDSLLSSDKFHRDAAEALALEETHLGKHKLPDLSTESAERCEELSHEFNDEVLKIAAGNGALTSILGLGSTYISASASADTFPPMCRALTKAYYADSVAELKKSGAVTVDDEKLKRDALEKALGQINGKAGYAHLQLALAANSMGAFLGDPPQWFSLLQNPLKDHAKVTVDGMAISEALNTSLTTIWLIKTGLFSLDEAPRYTAELLNHQLKATNELAKTILDGQTRNAAFSSASRPSEEITDILAHMQQSGEYSAAQIEDLRARLKSVRHPLVEFDIGKILNEKRSVISALATNGYAQKVAEQMRGKTFEEIYDAVQSSNSTKEREAILNAYEKERVTHNVTALRDVFVSLLTEPNGEKTVREKLKEFGVTISTESESPLTKLFTELVLNPNNHEGTREKAQKAFETLGYTDVQEALNQGLDRYRGITPIDESHVEGDHGQGEASNAHAHGHTEKEPTLFGHTAKEVEFALFTQLPAVEAAATLALAMLPNIVGYEAGESLTEDQLEQATLAVLIAVSGLSAVADNVAAYNFGRKVLRSLYRQTYGEQFDTDEDMQYYTNAAPLIAAMISGSGSKIGNGANFHTRKLEAELRGNDIITEYKALDLGESFLNPYAGIQIAGTTALLWKGKDLLPSQWGGNILSHAA